MTVETVVPVSEWTIGTLKILLEEKLDSLSKRVDATNEWRGTVNDVMATRIAREAAESMIHALDEKLATVTSRLDKIEGRMGGISSVWVILLSIAGIMIALGGFITTLLMRVQLGH